MGPVLDNVLDLACVSLDAIFINPIGDQKPNHFCGLLNIYFVGS